MVHFIHFIREKKIFCLNSVYRFNMPLKIQQYDMCDESISPKTCFAGLSHTEVIKIRHPRMSQTQ